MTTMWKTSRGLFKWESHDILTPSKSTLDDLNEAFRAKEWNSFHLSRNKLVYLHLKDCLEYELYCT